MAMTQEEPEVDLEAKIGMVIKLQKSWVEGKTNQTGGSLGVWKGLTKKQLLCPKAFFL